MTHRSQIVVRSLLAATLAGLLSLTATVGAQTHAQSATPTIHFVGLVGASPAAAPVSAIVQAGTKPATFSPNYLSTCVSTNQVAFAVLNKTSVSQSLTSLPDQTVVATIPAGQVGKFGVSGTFPGFVLAGLASNHNTALVVYCT